MSKNYWYPRFPGDYKKDTAHLSLTEHGAYTVLMDHYYVNGPIPAYEDPQQPVLANANANAKHLYRICGALDENERQAVDLILRNFFTIKDGFYHNKRADAEMEKREKISEKRRDAQATMIENKYKNRHKKDVANANAKGLQMQTQSHSQDKVKDKTLKGASPDEDFFIDDFWGEGEGEFFKGQVIQLDQKNFNRLFKLYSTTDDRQRFAMVLARRDMWLRKQNKKIQKNWLQSTVNNLAKKKKESET